jgi:hypothetical protein
MGFQRADGGAFIELVSSGEPALKAVNDDTGSLMLQAVSSTTTNTKTPTLQGMTELTAVYPNKR